MFHAEKLRYAPLRGAYLQAGVGAEAFFPALKETCNELDIRCLKEETPPEYPLYLLRLGENNEWQLHFRKSETHEEKLIYESKENSSDDPLSDLLDAMLAATEEKIKESVADQKPDLDYLRKTFANQKDQYYNLLVLMVKEYEISKEAISESIEQHDLERYRQVKHKLQPSTSYLRMSDFTRLLEEVKNDFESVWKGERKDLTEKIFSYFDVIIHLLKKELEEN